MALSERQSKVREELNPRLREARKHALEAIKPHVHENDLQEALFSLLSTNFQTLPGLWRNLKEHYPALEFVLHAEAVAEHGGEGSGHKSIFHSLATKLAGLKRRIESEGADKIEKADLHIHDATIDGFHFHGENITLWRIESGEGC
ncbi:MAG: hypothetical protein NUW37_05300 [Planctomycetes bacterium]|nr:hypothetical protein [Planctomycetota bacterium]